MLARGKHMSIPTKYYLVTAEALPYIFLKVAEAKRLLQSGEVKTIGKATELVGISRSAFYKYKDAIQPFYNFHSGKIITFNSVLKDNPGVLSEILKIFANSGANILTINQSIPNNGVAAVTISAETANMQISMEEFVNDVNAASGVVKFEFLAG